MKAKSKSVAKEPTKKVELKTPERETKAAKQLHVMAKPGNNKQLSRLLAMQIPPKQAEEKEADK